MAEPVVINVVEATPVKVETTTPTPVVVQVSPTVTQAQVEAALPPSVASGSTVGAGYNGLLWSGTAWVQAHLAQQPATTEPTVYVAKGGSDSNSGLVFGFAKATIHAAFTQLEALSGGTGKVKVGVGSFTEPPLVRPNGAFLEGEGENLTEVVQEVEGNGNAIQDAAWGTTGVGTGGGLADIFINGNNAHQTATIPQCIVGTETSVTSGGVTLPIYGSTAGFSASGKIWVGKTVCEYTEREAETFKGVKPVAGFSAFTATPELRIIPFNSQGHCIAIQSTNVLQRNVKTKFGMGSGRCFNAASGSAFPYGCVIEGGTSSDNFRYDQEIGPLASDGKCSNFESFGSKMGALFLGGADWMFTNYHPTSEVKAGYGKLEPQLLQIAQGSQQFRNLYLDRAPYDVIRLDGVALGSSLNDLMIEGRMYECSEASTGAGMGVAMYGLSTTEALRLDINLGCISNLYAPICKYPRTRSVGVQNFAVPPGGKIQVINALGLSPKSALGGVLTYSGGTLAYTGTEAHATNLKAEAANGATTVELESTAGLASSGILTVYPPSRSESFTIQILIEYTEIIGNVLHGCTGITEALPAGTPVAQHFLTGCSGGTGTAVANGTGVTQEGRVIPTTSGRAHFVYSKRAVTGPQLAPPNVRLTWEFNEGTTVYRNPFLGKITINVGSKEQALEHHLGTEPTRVFMTPSTEPQQEWWYTKSSTTVTAHLKANAATNTVVFDVEAWFSQV